MILFMGPKRYTPQVERLLAKLRVHTSSRTPARLPPTEYAHRIKPKQREVASSAEKKVLRAFKKPVEQRIALEIFREIRKGPVYLEDLSANIACRHKFDVEVLSVYGTTTGAVKSLFAKLIKAGLIK